MALPISAPSLFRTRVVGVERIFNRLANSRFVSASKSMCLTSGISLVRFSRSILVVRHGEQNADENCKRVSLDPNWVPTSLELISNFLTSDLISPLVFLNQKPNTDESPRTIRVR